ncbi:VWA domain-containing protein [Paenibacillus sp. GCM10023252]|uniref:VWA domain-containing protein n=1 Tax=Paenibacillus sp. GCM10023252 TaxID=3252649 RepID=UPI0036095F95
MQAEAPWALLLIIPCSLWIWWIIRATSRLQGGRRVAAVSIRTLILMLLISAIAQLQPYLLVKQRDVVFVADRSASVQAEAAIGQWIQEAYSSRDDKDRGAIVTTALDAVVERALSPNSPGGSGGYSFRTVLNDHFTNLAGGLNTASGLLSGTRGGRVILLSDGEENTGDMLRQARLLKEAGIQVDVVPLSSTVANDMAVESLQVPQSLRQGETFTFEIAVNSTLSGSAELRLYSDNREISRTTVDVQAGENRYALQSTALEPGFHRFRAEIYAAGDEREQNNISYAFSKVSGPPAVLIVEGRTGSSGNIEAALDSSYIGHTTIAPEQLSVELAEYAAYDSIVLNNVPATRIAEKPMNWIGKAVSDYGVGLVMLGGDDSYGLGGYFKTPIEAALPVYMDLKGKRKIPSLGLVLVIDRSGSMSDGKLELAKEAAMRTVELLREEDTVGVLAFDSAPAWIVEPTKLTDRESVLSKIGMIQPSGGTEIYSALDAAHTKQLESTAERKHIILLTDGQSGMNSPYSELTQSMVDHSITLSTVAVGDGSDVQLLERLAKEAKGRYYFTKDQSTLPAIFSRETVLMSRTYIVEQTFIPQIGRGGNWSSLWKGGLPRVNAYVATTAKETAETALLTPEGDPLLSRWAYGSGRAVAWTSDLTGRWAPEWVSWPDLPKVLTQWIKWTFPQFESQPYAIDAKLEGQEAKLHIRAEGSRTTGSSDMKAVIQGESGQLQTLRPIPVAPGEYEASLPVGEPGVYLGQVSSSAGGAGGAAAGGTTTGFVIPYSPEYRLSSDDGKLKLARLAELTGGRVLGLDDASLAYDYEPKPYRQAYDMTHEWLAAALLLWLVDIAIRRISLSSAWMQLGKRLRQRLASDRSTVPVKTGGAVASMNRLQERTKRAGEFYSGSGNNGGASAAEPLVRPSAPSAAPASRPATRPAGQPVPKSDKQTTPDESPDQNLPDSNVTMNRLLAAKNRSKR